MKAWSPRASGGHRRRAGSRVDVCSLENVYHPGLFHPATLQPAIGPEPPPKLLAGRGSVQGLPPLKTPTFQNTPPCPLSAPKIWWPWPLPHLTEAVSWAKARPGGPRTAWGYIPRKRIRQPGVHSPRLRCSRKRLRVPRVVLGHAVWAPLTHKALGPASLSLVGRGVQCPQLCCPWSFFFLFLIEG